MSSGAGQNRSGRKKGKMNRLTRISKDEYYLKIAEAVLYVHLLTKEVWAVIVKNDEILDRLQWCPKERSIA